MRGTGEGGGKVGGGVNAAFPDPAALSQGPTRRQSGEGAQMGEAANASLRQRKLPRSVRPGGQNQDPCVHGGRSTGLGVRSRGSNALFTCCVTWSKSPNLSGGSSFTCARQVELVGWCPGPILG